MGVPKRRRSKAKMRSHKAANRWHAPKLVTCSQCGSRTIPHHACPSCGYYAGRQVLTVEAV